MLKIVALTLLLVPAAPSVVGNDEDPLDRAWTILFYGASDNDSEESFVPDMESLANGFEAGDAVELLFLVDRSPKYSTSKSLFGDDFADTRLYRYDGERAVRISGGSTFPEITTESTYEANTGDAHTLKKALRFAKETYPARNTAVVFYSHGGGDSWCPDEASGGDMLWTSELTQVLSEEESVDLLVFDVCSMAAIENAYQWRPGNGRFSADIMVATPNAGLPFPWEQVFQRIRLGEAPEGERSWFDPNTLSAADFGRVVVEETRAHCREAIVQDPEYAEEYEGEAMVCMDLTRAAAAKEAMDSLARSLGQADTKTAIEAIRGEGDVTPTMNYFVPGENSWAAMPYFDIYDLTRRIAGDEQFEATIRAQAKAAQQAVDALVLTSFGGGRYDPYGGFQAGKNGVHIVFPDGDATFRSRRIWGKFGWYHPEPTGGVGSSAPGDYAFCRDGATPGNAVVDNWFELLDSWYDADNDEDGGVNGYRW